jgi:hypothetical protein
MHSGIYACRKVANKRDKVNDWVKKVQNPAHFSLLIAVTP